MSAFRGRPRQSEGYRERPLIQLVEEYLLQNSHQYFVNMDEMGAYIRRKSFRFARMKFPVFMDQLKRAYALYTDSKENQNDNMSPTEMDAEASDSSDLDWKIDESPTDTGANQMNNLYRVGSSNGNAAENAAKNENEDASNDCNVPESMELSRKQDSLDCISVNSDVSTKCNTTLVSSSVKQDAEINDDSGSDLEIIEEVKVIDTYQLNKNTVIVKGRPNGNLQPMQPIQVPQDDNKSVYRGCLVRNVHSSDVKNQPTMPIKNGPASVPSPSVNKKETNKGTKRKTAAGSESSFGINEDLTRKRPKKEVSVVHNTGFKLNDFAGSEKVVEEVCKLLMHLKHPEIYHTLGVTPPRGFLLHGPPGTGKTLLANAIAGELELPMLKVAGTELVSGISGESESNIRELFNQAVSVAPCIVFIDEIDSVTPKRDNVSKEMERRIVAQLLACIDDLGNKEKGDQVLLVGATNRVEAIDTALRRAGRFDREICLGIPDENSREKILSVICRDLRLEPEFHMNILARLTPGYVGADLQALVREAAVQAVNRQIILGKTSASSEGEKEKVNQEKEQEEKMEVVPNPESDKTDLQELDKKEVIPDDKCNPLTWIKEISPLSQEELKDLFVTMKDFESALKNVQPSSKREGFATVPDTTWDDIGALHEIRDELQVSIMGPVKHAEAFRKLGLTTPAGVLLCGPPGCGKTLLAKAVANEAGINFISVKGPELLNMYVGESERAVRQCFMRARNSSPCVIFFDELDALCPRRSDVADSGSGGRIVNQLLTEMDGMESRLGVFVMAATNRPDIIDPAILRPGRLDKILFVNLPTAKDRHEILKALTKNSTRPVLDEDVNLEEISNCAECENYTGADLSALVREASIAAFRELVLNNQNGDSKDLKVYRRHFTTGFSKTKPSVSKEDRANYNRMAEKYSSIH